MNAGRTVLFALSLPIAVVCARREESSAPALATRVDSLADRFFEVQLRRNPERGTELGLPNADHVHITDNSQRGIAKARTAMDSLYTLVHGIDPLPLAGKPQEVTYAVPREAPDDERALRVCRPELWGVASYVNGWQAIYTDLALLQPVGTDTLRAMALARARALVGFRATMGARFDIRAFHDRGREDGTVPLAQLRQKIERWIAARAGT